MGRLMSTNYKCRCGGPGRLCWSPNGWSVEAGVKFKNMKVNAVQILTKEWTFRFLCLVKVIRPKMCPWASLYELLGIMEPHNPSKVENTQNDANKIFMKINAVPSNLSNIEVRNAKVIWGDGAQIEESQARLGTDRLKHLEVQICYAR